MVLDLNADVGEGFGVYTLGTDRELMAVITSANVACGFHAGDPSIMRVTCDAAVANGVAIGAQVSYRDLAGFGRRSMRVPVAELEAEILYQIGALDVFARIAGDRVRYVKPHGALYNDAAAGGPAADALLGAMHALTDPLPLLCLAGSALHLRAAAEGIETVGEAFADRAYEASGSLVPRTEPGAVLHDEAAVVARSRALAAGEPIPSIDGMPVAIAARSLCVHSDTPGAARLARAVRDALGAAGVTVRAFA